MTPLAIPSTSCDAKPKGMKGVKCAQSILGRTMKMKAQSAASFTTTRTEVTAALVRVPMMRRAVTMSTAPAARRLTPPPWTANMPAFNESGIGMPRLCKRPAM